MEYTPGASRNTDSLTGAGGLRPSRYTPGLQALGSTYEYGVERLSYYDEEEGDCYAYAYDGRGSVANLTGETGESVVSYTYDIYGSVEESGAQADLPNPYLYRGEYTDALTGNQYLRARYYRPSTGCFLTRDTYPGDQTEPVSLNRYTYAGNDPVNLEDPSGHGVVLQIRCTSSMQIRCA